MSVDDLLKERAVAISASEFERGKQAGRVEVVTPLIEKEVRAAEQRTLERVLKIIRDQGGDDEDALLLDFIVDDLEKRIRQRMALPPAPKVKG